MIRLVQLQHPRQGRRIAVVSDGALQLINNFRSAYELACVAADKNSSLAKLIAKNISAKSLDYDEVYAGKSAWRLLPAFDHPEEPTRCLVTGTGLTHRISAENRQAMHVNTKKKVELTDSMKMFQWGVEGGRPKKGAIGVSPEWFYKGCGTILRAHGESLDVPPYADDGGDEAEIAGVYIVDRNGNPRRVGLVQGNEFSDHMLETKNYLYLAHSKLRFCAIGPELIVEPDFNNVKGTAQVLRNGKAVWSHAVHTGEKNMSHTLANLEHHHFKYAMHRRSGDIHIHFFGADAFSFGDGVALENGDVMQIEFSGFGRPLQNPIKVDRSKPKFVAVEQL